MKDLMTFNPPAIVMQQEQVDVKKIDKIKRAKAIIDRDFDEFTRNKKFVLDNMSTLRGTLVPMEVTSIQSLEEYECLIINDQLLYSFAEAKPLIEAILKARKELEERQDE